MTLCERGFGVMTLWETKQKGRGEEKFDKSKMGNIRGI